MDWRDIATAPKDEEVRILACVAGTKIPAVAIWDEDDQRWYAFNRTFRDDWRPTHWMPLPEPPSDEGK